MNGKVLNMAHVRRMETAEERLELAKKLITEYANAGMLLVFFDPKTNVRASFVSPLARPELLTIAQAASVTIQHEMLRGELEKQAIEALAASEARKAGVS